MGDHLGTTGVVGFLLFYFFLDYHIPVDHIIPTLNAHLTIHTSPYTPHRTHTATPKFTMTPPDMNLVYGNTATISCAFNGYPNPSVVWRRDRETLNSDGRMKITSCATSSILEVIQLQYEDAGIYTCYITNQQGSNSASMMLSIHGTSCDCHVRRM